jgi:ribonuclease VapC
MLDTSALVAMINDVPEAPGFEAVVAAAPVRLMSTAPYLEAAIVIEARSGEPGGRELDLWLHPAGVDLVAIDAEQAEAARPPTAVTAGAGIAPV